MADSQEVEPPLGFKQWLIERNAHVEIDRPLDEIEMLFQHHFPKQGSPLEPNESTFRIPDTKQPPYPYSNYRYATMCMGAYYAITHSRLVNSAELGRRMWNLSNDETFQFAVRYRGNHGPAVWRLWRQRGARSDGVRESAQECMPSGQSCTRAWAMRNGHKRMKRSSID